MYCLGISCSDNKKLLYIRIDKKISDLVGTTILKQDSICWQAEYYVLLKKWILNIEKF